MKARTGFFSSLLEQIADGRERLEGKAARQGGKPGGVQRCGPTGGLAAFQGSHMKLAAALARPISARISGFSCARSAIRASIGQ